MTSAADSHSENFIHAHFESAVLGHYPCAFFINPTPYGSKPSNRHIAADCVGPIWEEFDFDVLKINLIAENIGLFVG